MFRSILKEIFQLVSGFFRHDSKFKSSFSEESKILWQHLNTVYAPIYSKLACPVSQEACFVIGSKRQYICAVWIIIWSLQIHCNQRILVGAIKLVSKEYMKNIFNIILMKFWFKLYIWIKHYNLVCWLLTLNMMFEI